MASMTTTAAGSTLGTSQLLTGGEGGASSTPLSAPVGLPRTSRRSRTMSSLELDVSTTGPSSTIDGQITPSSVSAASLATSTVGPASMASPKSNSEALASNSSVWTRRWRKGQLIGQGSYGSVYKAIDEETGHIFAVKKASLSSNGEGQKYVDQLRAELEIYCTLSHPHIVRYLGHQSVEDHFCILLEYVAGGSMAAVLQEFGPICGRNLHRAARGLVEGLHYLHSRDPPVVHRDIKCANLLVDTKFCVKLADFGCSKRSSQTQSFTIIGSLPWMAPEVILQENGHGRKADIWSLGCTVLEMITAQKPWGDNAFNNTIFAMRTIAMTDALPPVPDGVPADCRDFVFRCVCREVSERPTAGDLLEDAFICS